MTTANQIPPVDDHIVDHIVDHIDEKSGLAG